MTIEKWKLDTMNDGNDAILEGTYKEVLKDILHHHELEKLPEHWILTKINWEE